MALIKFGGGVVQMAGSIGGTTFARNRSGNYARARTTPVNPNTALQVVVRAAMAWLTDRWSLGLTAVQRTAWNLYAANVVMANRLGESINLSGFNHYIRTNLIRKQLGLSIIDAGPVIFEIPASDPVLSITASAATQIITVTYDDTLNWANETEGFLFFFQGLPQNPQRNFFGGPWRSLGSVAGETGIPPPSPALPAAVYAIAAGQRQWIYARISRADGRLSAPFRADVFTGA